jgi:hypothetical protein
MKRARYLNGDKWSDLGPDQRDLGPLLAVGLLVMFLLMAPFAAIATWRPEYAQLSDQERQWFRTQRVPGKGYTCCSEADGAQAQEDISGEHYRVRFTARRHPSIDMTQFVEEDSGWMDVPDEAVIREPNKHGSPVVWYYWKAGATLTIRCYAPGPGL